MITPGWYDTVALCLYALTATVSLAYIAAYWPRHFRRRVVAFAARMVAVTFLWVALRSLWVRGFSGRPAVFTNWPDLLASLLTPVLLTVTIGAILAATWQERHRPS